jgi:helicase required for RNAi-mediated heterochromatin assembly 1
MGAACRVSFSTERSEDEIDWRRTNRLTPGQLVVLSPRDDAFRKRCIVATVAGRQLIGGLEPDLVSGESQSTPPRIDIFWSASDDALLDPETELVMIETKGGYFESLRHTMVGLQQASFHE